MGNTLTLTNVAPSVAFTQGGATVTLAPSLSVSDSDSATLANATVAITGGAFAGDVLAANTSGTSITANYNSATETLTLTGSDTLADYQQVLDSVTFDSTSRNPTDYGSDATRSLTWTVNDGGASNNIATATEAIDITSVNLPPTLIKVASANYTEGGASVTLASAASVSDPDDLDLTSATVSILHGTFTGDDDVLAADGQTSGTIVQNGNTITIAYNATGETLTLTGTDTLADYQTVLDEITFNNTSGNPTDDGADRTRTVIWVLNNDGSTANGGTQVSAPVTQIISIAAAYQPPTLSNVATSVTYPDGATVTLSSSASLSDPDDLYLTGATVSITGDTFAGDGDVLAVNGLTSGIIVQNETNTITLAYNTSSETLTLAGSDTLVDYQQLLDALTFDSTSANPSNDGSDPTRTVTWVLNNGGTSNNLSTAQTETVNVMVGPFLTAPASVGYTQNGGPVTLASNASLTNFNSTTLVSATVALTSTDLSDGTFTEFGQASDDVLLFSTAGTAITASYNSTTERLTLTGTDTVAHYQQVLDSVEYNNTGENPGNYGSDPTRVVTWTLNDGAASNNIGTSTETIDITTVNQPPTLSNVATSAQFTEGGLFIALSPSVTVSDPDGLDLASATIAIVGGTFAGDGDVLAPTNEVITENGNNFITASYDSTTETLTLTGTDTLAHYQSVLDSTVEFGDTGLNPTDYGSDPTRTVTWVLNNGGSSNNLSTPVTTTVSITAVHSPPTLSNVATSASVTVTAETVTLSPSLSVSDPDSLDLTNATVAITGGTFAGDVLTANTSGTSITASYNSSTETLTLTGSDTLSDYQQVLDSVTFGSTSSNPTTRTVTWTVNDGAASNSIATAATTISIRDTAPFDFTGDGISDLVFQDQGAGAGPNAGTPQI